MMIEQNKKNNKKQTSKKMILISVDIKRSSNGSEWKFYHRYTDVCI